MMTIFLVASLFALILGPVEGQEPYLDPGSGSILLQLVVAAALGGLIVLRTSWGRIRSFFGRDVKDEDDDDDGEDEE
jgi:hypothetical protein